MDGTLAFDTTEIAELPRHLRTAACAAPELSLVMSARSGLRLARQLEVGLAMERQNTELRQGAQDLLDLQTDMKDRADRMDAIWSALNRRYLPTMLAVLVTGMVMGVVLAGLAA